MLSAGSLSTEMLGALDRGRSTASRYLAVEGHRALAAHGDILPPAVRPTVDHVVAGRSDRPAASLVIAQGREPVVEAPPSFGIIRPKQVRATRTPGQDDEAARHVARTSREQTLRELDDGEDTEHDGAVDMLNPVGASGALGRLMQKLLSNSRSKGKGAPGADTPTHRSKHGGRVGRGAAVSSSRADLPDEVEALAHAVITYPEWNVFQRRYRHDWCTVTEVETTPAPTELPPSRDAHALRRSLTRLGLDLERRRRQPQGDDIDIDATVEARVELAAGTAADEAIYIDTVRNRRELSVLVLLDISGSAGEPSESGGTVHDHQVATATALTSALHDLGDRVALYGFRSQGRSAVQMVPVKRFGDRFDASTRRRLNGLVPAAYTRMGTAIRHGSSVLEDSGGTVRRLLVVLSDGFAYDHNYEGAYAEADARRALAEARRRGTACLCLSIGAGTDAESLRRVFGTAAYASFRRTDQLASTAGPLFLSALKLAEVQRRSSQRQERTRERLHIERRSA
jgi:nitric oxide reductase activation protein